MKTLAQFKAEHGVSTIDFLRGNGRAYAKVGNDDLVVSTNFNSGKPAFVTWNDKGFYVLVNSEVKVVMSL